MMNNPTSAETSAQIEQFIEDNGGEALEEECEEETDNMIAPTEGADELSKDLQQATT